ncbi:Wzz/FepE/Etk N-terminal domain-containing protein [Acidaminobacter hydrogenoformans]|uniref:G-rich domain on putative tyrosine kinase n=1 Tax=Acidaminobacter hydrogenoformans DSM 2784 TaxID=1120920 RepID=A0A1G5RYY0_9FIRM|nr:Wzz/FepE/Etk N-terminal domain-containing protein [Acidaminobacter hydrogenoformans]SCZ79048.1 G-rich domain on putative tyrosine kinase [Acidaminobacter hydrogenoformans DSM 2784]
MQNSSERHEMNHNDYDEISLKELILSIWSERKLIAVILAVTVVLTGIYTFVIASPQYETTSVLIIKKPVETSTPYGTYTFPSENINDYIQFIYSNEVSDRIIAKHGFDISSKSFKNMITITQDKDANRFQVTVKNEDPEMAYQINNDLINQYVDSLRLTYKKQALESFIFDYQSQIESLNNSIEYKEAILAETSVLLSTLEPVITLQKMLSSDPIAAAAYADRRNLDLASLSDDVMTEEIKNDSYFNVEAQVVNTEVELINLRQSLNNKNELLGELSKELENYNSLITTENESQLLNGKLDVMAQNVFVTSKPYQPDSPVAPRKALNMAIGLVLGMMLGVFMGLFKAYWKNS